MQKRSIKIKNSILVKKWVKFQNEANQLTVFIDFEAKINLINQVYVMQWKLKSVIVDLSLSKFLNNQNRYY